MKDLEKERIAKFKELRKIIDDIRRIEPDEEEWERLEDNGCTDFWEEIANMDEALSDIGI